MSMNKVLIVGRIGQDPKLSYTPSGQAVASFSIATDEGYKDKATGNKVDKVEWHKVVAWRGQAEFAANYLSKGRLVLVEGKLQTRKWQGNDGSDRFVTEIVATSIQGLDKPQQENSQHGGYQQQGRGGYRQNKGNQNNGYQPQNNGPEFPTDASEMEDVPF